MLAPSIALPAKPAALNLSLALGAEDLKRVDALMLARVSAEIPLIRDITQHIIAGGGKRLRPLLTLLCARLCGYKGERHVGLAASVEFIHTATLLHDDVVDDSHLRRGLPTANDAFGNKGSVLVGDFLLAQAFQLMVADRSLESLKILSDAAAVISRGEVKQLMSEGEPETPIDDYLEIIHCKTAALFAAACELGPVVAEKHDWREPLRAYGEAVGMAFQLVDDALDYGADEAQLGKSLGDDFREGKITLPVILAYRAGSETEKQFWRRTLEQKQQEPGDFTQALRFIEEHESLKDSFSQARLYCDQALQALAPLPAAPEKQALTEIVDFCAGRMY